MLASLAVFLSACDPIGYGYVNQLHRPVAVVHHVHGREERFTLAPGQRKLPGLGDWEGSREEFFDLNGKQVAVITREEIDRMDHKDYPTVLVLSPTGITLATREDWDQWQQELRNETHKE